MVGRPHSRRRADREQVEVDLRMNSDGSTPAWKPSRIDDDRQSVAGRPDRDPVDVEGVVLEATQRLGKQRARGRNG